MTDNYKEISALRRGSKYKRGAGARAAETTGRVLRDARRVHSASVAEETPEPAGGKGSRGPKAYQLLREAIASAKLKPGDRVLESELATMFSPHSSSSPPLAPSKPPYRR